jgi:8-oxo-dGTP pyrophosphatase MutT (NUDIX family)
MVPGVPTPGSQTDFALVIPEERDGFHLVEQYRYPTRRRSWEFPQGTFRHPRPLDDPRDLAMAELEEETGLRAGRIRALGRLDIAPGLTSQGGHVFLATELVAGPPRREPEEQDMRQRWVPRADFEGMVRAGEITDGPTIAAYALLLLHER